VRPTFTLLALLLVLAVGCGASEHAAPKVSGDAPKANCTCRNVAVGGRYPQASGHAAPYPREALSEVLSIDEARCIAVTRLLVTQEQGEKPCDADIFQPPVANPAG
jgi:hypothetical protein